MKTINHATLTIAIVSHKQSSLVERLLSSLEAYKPPLKFRVVVLENVPHQPVIDLGKYSFEANYLQNQSQTSLSRNLNKIFELYGEEFNHFCILNPDIVFDSEVFSKLLSIKKQHQIGIIAPIAINNKLEIQDSFRPIPKPFDLILRYTRLKTERFEYQTLPEISYPEWVAAMFLLMESSVFKQLGGFNPRYRLYFEDVDFSIRARMQNYSIAVLKTVHVIHEGQRTSHKKAKYLYHHLLSAIKFYTSAEYQASLSLRKTKSDRH